MFKSRQWSKQEDDNNSDWSLWNNHGFNSFIVPRRFNHNGNDVGLIISDELIDADRVIANQPTI
jgi:hypothetical protein